MAGQHAFGDHEGMKTAQHITLPDGRIGRVLKDDGEMLHVLIAKFSQAGLRPTVVQVPR